MRFALRIYPPFVLLTSVIIYLAWTAVATRGLRLARTEPQKKRSVSRNRSCDCELEITGKVINSLLLIFTVTFLLNASMLSNRPWTLYRHALDKCTEDTMSAFTCLLDSIAKSDHV
jgi:hypothetical protein